MMDARPRLAGVEIRPLERLEDARGAVMRMLRADAPHFERFGEIYFSTIVPGAVKAWRRHTRITSNLAVPVGGIRIVLYDERSTSPTRGQLQEIETGKEAYALVTVPPGLWYGWTCLGTMTAVVANCTTEPHDPQEAERLDVSDPRIPYRWSV